MAVATPSVTDICRAAQAASRELAAMGSADKDVALLRVADALEERAPEILEANARDLEAGRDAGLSDALMDRLALEVPALAISSTECRARVAKGNPTWYLVPDGIVQYIAKRELYTNR